MSQSGACCSTLLACGADARQRSNLYYLPLQYILTGQEGDPDSLKFQKGKKVMRGITNVGFCRDTEEFKVLVRFRFRFMFIG